MDVVSQSVEKGGAEVTGGEKCRSGSAPGREGRTVLPTE